MMKKLNYFKINDELLNDYNEFLKKKEVNNNLLNRTMDYVRIFDKNLKEIKVDYNTFLKDIGVDKSAICGGD
jgi:hypothetical protein